MPTAEIPTPPPLRAVTCDCLTAAGWLSGAFHVPMQQGFGDYLQHGGAFLPMTDVILPGEDRPRPFFALQREDIRMALPDPAQATIETLPPGGFTSPWSVSCLLPEGVIEGQIDFLTNQRLSDHLRVSRGYVVVREARWAPLSDAARAPVGAESWPVALINIQRLVGIAEATTQRGYGHPGRYNTTASDYEVG